MSALLKKSAENNNNGAVVGEKRPITNNDGGNNTPALFLCCQNGVKTVSGVEVDLEILSLVGQEHQIPQNLGDAISERLALVIQNHWSYEPEKFGNIKDYMKNYWSHKIVEKYAPLSWTGRFSAITTYQTG